MKPIDYAKYDGLRPMTDAGMPDGGGIDLEADDAYGQPETAIQILYNGGDSDAWARLIVDAPDLLQACRERDAVITNLEDANRSYYADIVELSNDIAGYKRTLSHRDARIAELEAALESMTNARDEYARLARAYLIRLQVIDPDGYGRVKDGKALDL